MAAILAVERPLHRVTFAPESSVKHYNPINSPLSLSASKFAAPDSPNAASPKRTRVDAPHRPEHRRRRSRVEVADVLADLALAFSKALTKAWGPQDGFKTLARDFFAVAVGFSAGHKIKNYLLDRSQTTLLALELSKIIQTTNVVLLLDPQSQTLFAIHTQILNGRMQGFPHDDGTVFLKVWGGKPHIIPASEATFVADGIKQIQRLLGKSNRQILQTCDFTWSPLEAAYYMLTLGDWLLASPVCYVLEAGLGQGSTHLQDILDQGQMYWTVHVHADGIDPDNDHRFEACKIPAVLFPDRPEWSTVDAAAQGKRQGLTDTTCTLNTMQDRLQNKMYERLDACAPAMTLWSDVSCAIEGPSAF